MLIIKPNWLAHAKGKRRFEVYSCHVSPDGKRLATAGLDGTVRIWSTEAILKAGDETFNGPKEIYSISAHAGAVFTVRWSGTNRYLASGSSDRLVLVYERDPESGHAEKWRTSRKLSGHENAVQDVGWSIDSSILVSVGLDSKIIIWSGRSFELLECLSVHQSAIRGITFDPANKYFATASDDRSIKVFKLKPFMDTAIGKATGRSLTEATVTEPFVKSPTTMFKRCSWSVDGSNIAVANATNGPVTSVAIIDRGSWKHDISLIGHERPVEVCSFAPRMFTRNVGPGAANIIACASQCGSLSLWCTSIPRPQVVFKNLVTKPISDLGWSPDAKSLFATSLDGSIVAISFEGDLGDSIGPEFNKRVRRKFEIQRQFMTDKAPEDTRPYQNPGIPPRSSRFSENMGTEMASTQRRVSAGSNPLQSPPRDALALDHPCDLENLSTTNYEFEGGRSAVEIGARIATDSGYVSITRGTEVCAQSDHGIRFQSLNTSEHMSTAMDHLDLDDTKTVYSDASSVPTLVKESYISELADALLNEVLPHKPDADTLERISLVLPDVLKAFALKIGQNAPTQMHRDVMFFIHKSRGDIAKHFNRKIPNEQEQEENGFSTHIPASDGMLYTEVVERWRLEDPQGTILEDPQDPLLMKPRDPALREPEDPILEEPQDLARFWETSLAEDAILPNADTSGTILNELICPESDEEVKGDDGQEINVPQLPAYRDFIFKVAAYEWLLGRLSRELFLTPARPNIMDKIRETIAQKLPSNHRISRSQSAETFKVIFVVRWNPMGFIAEQDYEEEPGEAIEKAITLTGSTKDAQALTCKEYFCQTWRSGGKHTIQLIKDTVQNGPHNLQASALPDGTQLRACIQDSKLIVEAIGTRDSVAEVGEQLGWLGAAFYSSTWDAGLTSIIPIINEINPRDISKSTPGPPHCPELICDIDFIVQERAAYPVSSTNPISSNGQCWHKMFRNPVVVEGYPILRRPRVESGIGLEIRLNMMAGLVQTKRVNIFDGKIFIKGYSAMLVPIKKDGDMLIWHFLYSDTGERISYLDKTFHAEDISIPALETARHVVGWCSKASYHAGAADAVYNIKSSRLPKTHGGCALREVCAIRGQIVSGGSQFAIGNKDIPLRLSRKGKWHIPGLKWIHKKFVVMWDEQDKRGWLVNGTSALLHLLYGSLAHDSTDEFSSKFLFKKERMHEAIKPHKACSAIEVLLNENNLKQVIYPGESVHYCVEDRLEELYNMLEKIIDYQMTVSSTPSTPRYLEGWDFKDLATGGDPIYPRVATLEAIGQSWVDFTRAIHAIALFGRGFGEIIQPTDTGMCTYWKELPKQKYYLAAGLRDLRSIMGLGIDEEIEMPPKLVDDVVWHIPQSTFGQCQCKEKKSEDHSDFVQALLPSKFSRFLPENEPIRWDDDGAVIFGHNASFEWLWRDSRDLQGDEPVMPSEEPKAPSLDSGIGLNLLFGPEDYTIGVICALQKELLAVRALFDSRHEDLHLPLQDTNHYALGRIHRHNIVAACLPSGEYGTNAAAQVLSHMIRSFTKVEFCCLVGIGAGIPTNENNLRLGDVVVSHPTGTHVGVIQYDLGKALGGDLFERTGCIQRLPTFILTAISSLRSDPNLPSQPLQRYIDDIIARCPEYKFPGIQHDKILVAECLDDPNHVACRRCSDQSRNHPKIHYGLIASGNQVIKDAKTRDRLHRDYKVHCIEMEAAGVMNVFPCVVIRGICDYADSDKNDLWQRYASATAAAYLKLLLSVIRNRDYSEGTGSRKRAASSLHYDSPSAKKLMDISYLVSPTKSQAGTTPDRGSTWTSQGLL
ncbi:hypothetical protein TWF225_006544 [Orbilia oligospora]|nr:hypothetical protein TWF225_006544 [Orbilia oligospora]